MNPEQAFSHPFISKAVNELKNIKTNQGEQPKSNKQTGRIGKNNDNDSMLPHINTK